MIPEWSSAPRKKTHKNLSTSNVPNKYFTNNSISKTAPQKMISSIDYSILSPQDILSQSHAEINTFQLYDLTRNPVKNGPLDSRLGIGNKSALCTTCGNAIDLCIGHFGHTHLNLPIYHLGYFKNLVNILKMVCKSCSKVMLYQPDKTKYMKRMKLIQKNYFQRLALWKKMFKQASKAKVCPNCASQNPSVQKIPKICAKVQIKSQQMKKQIVDGKIRRSIKQGNNQSKNQFQSIHGQFAYQLNPWDALKILQNIPQQQYCLLNIFGQTKVTDVIANILPIPPVTIRPSVMLTNALSNEDDLTMKIKDLVFLNKKIQDTMLDKGDEAIKIYKQWYLMQSHWSQYINGDAPGLPILQLKTASVRSLINRLKGKQGRFRQNLSGKRANFTARTVISPDPNLQITQVLVPQHMAKILTIQETVTSNTIQELQQCIQKGSQKRGGANFIITQSGQKIMVGTGGSSSGRFQKIQLKYGDIVERHLRDNDIVIFNRQPSLHRISMMGFFAKIGPGKTLRFNECVCAPFNADFDGDQMNIHVPQTLEARAQALHLMGVTQNIMTPKSGQPIIALIQDFLTTSFIITSRDMFFKRQQFTQILSYITDADQIIDLPPPTIFKPVALWTGKQVITAVLRPNKRAKICINFELKQKTYTSDGVMCKRDGYVIFRNGQHLIGQIGKSVLGGNKNGLIYNLLRDNTYQSACQIMHRISKLSGRWLSNYGMTIGISDVTPNPQLHIDNQQVIKDAYKKYEEYTQQYMRGKLEAKPGMSQKQTLQSYLNQTLSKVRNIVGDNCIDKLHRNNKPLIMALCGSKGNAVNLSQMIGCVGQQTVGGKRISYGFTQRTTPHFPRLCQSPQARGFVKNSFYSGLTATQFYFHTMGGRQGIIDTAVKTADTGYMQRRLIKLIEDIGVMYDYTVRTCDKKEIIQFRYGTDGLNPMKTQQDKNPINLYHLQTSVKNLIGSDIHSGKQRYLKPEQIEIIVVRFIKEVLFICKKREDSMSQKKQVKNMSKKKEQAQQQKQKDKNNKLSKKKSSTKKKTKQQQQKQMIDQQDELWRNMKIQDIPYYQYKVIVGIQSKLLEEVLLPKVKDYFEQKVSKLRKNYQEIQSKKFTRAQDELYLKNCFNGITDKQLSLFFKLYIKKLNIAVMQPGQAIGALTAQSIGQPATQMTLKTFHFAGISSMNITQGVPRVNQIINCAKNIATPIITINLNFIDLNTMIKLQKQSEQKLFAMQVKNLIENTTVGKILHSIQQIYDINQCSLNLIINLQLIKKMNMMFNIEKLKEIIDFSIRTKIKKTQILDSITLSVIPITKTNLMFELKSLRRLIVNLPIGGIKSITRCLISKDKDSNKHILFAEGTGLKQILKTPGVNTDKTITNHIVQIQQCLGIQAARQSIINQIYQTMQGHGINVNPRHINLLAQFMTYKGKIIGFTRNGVDKMKDSTLMLASFEKTSDFLFDAAVQGKHDRLRGVSQRIIMGQPIMVGTGMFDICQDLSPPTRNNVVKRMTSQSLIQKEKSQSNKNQRKIIYGKA